MRQATGRKCDMLSGENRQVAGRPCDKCRLKCDKRRGKNATNVGTKIDNSWGDHADRAAKNDDVQKTSNSETSLLRALISKLAGKIEEEKKDVGDAAKTDISGKGRSLSLLHGSGTTSSGKAAVVRAAQHLREMQAHAQKAGRNTGQATPSVSQSAAQTHKRTLQKLRGLLHSKPWSKTQGKKSVTDVGYDDPLEENYMEEMFERCVMTDEVGYQFLNYEDEECFDWDWAVYEVCYFQESETSPPGCDKWGDVWNDIYMANDELYIELYDSSYYGSGIGDYGYYDTSMNSRDFIISTWKSGLGCTPTGRTVWT
ncbi:hypothetical protein MAR_015413 [Mya arenaria]|uniref:Uncharacterized protein n=1 Tax=Mya arenaria TaxID=6604 RepID=A0ABY7FKN9_MYAAR|nr:hypothetical protein MAR_015413 [Mya arenaria]